MRRPFLYLVLLSAAVGRIQATGKVSDIHTNFHITLPKTAREFPEPLPAGAQPGFKVRGIKGWAGLPSSISPRFLTSRSSN